MRIQFPVEYIEGNIVVTPEKEFWAMYEINGFQYAHKSKRKQLEDFNRLLSVFSALNQPYRLYILPRVYSFHEHFKELEDRARGPFRESAILHSRETRDYLINSVGKEGSEYKAYLSIQLGDRTAIKDLFNKLSEEIGEIKEDFSIKGVKNYFKRVINNTERAVGVSGFSLTENELDKILNLEKMFYHKYQSGSFNQGYSLTKMLEEDIEWMVRRNWWKGIGEPPKSYIFQSDREKYELLESGEQIAVLTGRKKADIQEGRKRVIRPRKAEFIRMTEGTIDLDSNSRYIKIMQNVNDETRTSYSSYLAISELPEGLTIPGQEWLNVIYNVPFPIGISMYVNPQNLDETHKNVANKKLDIEDQEDQTSQGRRDLPLDLLHTSEDVLELEKHVADNKYFLCETTVTFEVFANDEDTLLKNREMLIGAMKDLDFELVTPAGNQWMLFNEFVPGASFHGDKDYMHPLTPPFLAASMVGATNTLGDNKGYFIGYQAGGLGIPVFFDPSEAPKRNRSASATFSGDLGGGKSYTANLIGGYLMPLYGGKTIIVDPKGDRSQWKDFLTEFESSFEYVRLDDREEDYGKLDPYGFLPPKEASKVATDIITFLANIKTSEDRFIKLSEAVNIVENSSKKSMYQIIKVLENDKDEVAQKLAKHLQAFQRAQFGRLLFFDGELNTIKTDKSLTIITIDNLNLPESDTPVEEYSISQMLSVGLMFPIGEYCIGFSKQKQFTTILFDEAWALLGSRQGKSLMNRLIRTGRSLNAAVFIISQNVKDLKEIKKNISVKFVFKVEDGQEVTEVLEYLELEDTEENRDLVKSISNGRPLMRDLDGRVGLVDIHVVFEHIHEAFNTTPEDEPDIEESQEENGEGALIL